jgi:hypothetical protein
LDEKKKKSYGFLVKSLLHKKGLFVGKETRNAYRILVGTFLGKQKEMAE